MPGVLEEDQDCCLLFLFVCWIQWFQIEKVAIHLFHEGCTIEQERCAYCMKSSYLVAGLFFKKVCLVSVPWCSRNTCLAYSCICALDLGFSCYFQDLGIRHVKINLKYLLKPRRSHDFS